MKKSITVDGNEVCVCEGGLYKGSLICTTEEEAIEAADMLRGGEFEDDEIADMKNGEWVY
jgi:hypothetical protein